MKIQMNDTVDTVQEKSKILRMEDSHEQPLLIYLMHGEAKACLLNGYQILGRPTKSSIPDIPLSDKTVSRRQCEFYTAFGRSRLRDSGSTNGTWLNGIRLEPGEVYWLEDGDLLRFCDKDSIEEKSDVFVEFVAASAVDSISERARELIRKEQEPVAVNKLQSESTKSKDAVASNLKKPVNRQPEKRKPENWESDNGEAENRASEKREAENRVPENRKSEKRASGDRHLAEHSFSLEDRLVIDIEERNVFEHFRKKTLLKDIYLEIEQGNMVLILGGSGAGKTTFMNAVMGYEKADGRILYRDMDVYQDYDRMKYEIGYVPQQDLMRMNDSVYNTIMKAAGMRLPKNTSRDELERTVADAMEMLGLCREKDTLAGKLSGGQRKRLSIAMEYVGNPSLFFLDEPDSGLDGTMAKALMHNLREIADVGKIVMVISHSPDRAFDLFDQVIVLAKDSRDNCGHLVFYGPPEEALQFFGVNNLEDIVQKINRPDEGGEGLAEHFINKFRYE